MKIDPGMAVTVGLLIVFYLRLMMLRGKKRRLAYEEEVARKKSDAQKSTQSSKNKKKNKTEAEEKAYQDFYKRNKPLFEVTNWWLLGIAVILMLAGLAMYNPSSWYTIPRTYQQYWWVVMALGEILFIFCFK